MARAQPETGDADVLGQPQAGRPFRPQPVGALQDEPAARLLDAVDRRPLAAEEIADAGGHPRDDDGRVERLGQRGRHLRQRLGRVPLAVLRHAAKSTAGRVVS